MVCWVVNSIVTFVVAWVVADVVSSVVTAVVPAEVGSVVNSIVGKTIVEHALVGIKFIQRTLWNADKIVSRRLVKMQKDQCQITQKIKQQVSTLIVPQRSTTKF